MIWVFILLIIALSYFIFAIFSIRHGIFIKSISRSPFGHGILTFDDGPHPEFTPKILALLEQYHQKAIFFCIGKNANEHPEIIKQIAAAGHILGNHTMNHSIRSTFSNRTAYLKEINDTTHLLQSISGQEIKYFRPPFGVTNPEIAAAIKKSGLISMAWNIRTFDTVSTDSAKICSKMIQNWNDDAIVLMHDNNVVTEEALKLFLGQISK
ncbi:MAG: polysaccharide deacetylase family protein [Saprospiraceae bacterium]|nr:MAG: polysaccharide deacetylase [Candidatus Parvibacillus calidus]MCC7148684.1 polysaccharide deacetylase family protein [Saprospiraceae bacterium]WKZ63567.1 MAG: polysaccharide deacetylase family protein [Saprospiraceae bacterium]